MNTLDKLKEEAGLGGTAAVLANEILTLNSQYENKELSKDEYTFLLGEIADVKANQQLANDENACRFIINAVSALSSIV